MEEERNDLIAIKPPLGRGRSLTKIEPQLEVCQSLLADPLLISISPGDSRSPKSSPNHHSRSPKSSPNHHRNRVLNHSPAKLRSPYPSTNMRSVAVEDISQGDSAAGDDEMEKVAVIAIPVLLKKSSGNSDSNHSMSSLNAMVKCIKSSSRQASPNNSYSNLQQVIKTDCPTCLTEDDIGDVTSYHQFDYDLDLGLTDETCRLSTRPVTPPRTRDSDNCISTSQFETSTSTITDGEMSLASDRRVGVYELNRFSRRAGSPKVVKNLCQSPTQSPLSSPTHSPSNSLCLNSSSSSSGGLMWIEKFSRQGDADHNWPMPIATTAATTSSIAATIETRETATTTATSSTMNSKTLITSKSFSVRLSTPNNDFHTLLRVKSEQLLGQASKLAESRTTSPRDQFHPARSDVYQRAVPTADDSRRAWLSLLQDKSPPTLQQPHFIQLKSTSAKDCDESGKDEEVENEATSAALCSTSRKPFPLID